MTYVLLPANIVADLHDSVLNPGELTGFAGDKSLESSLARVENRLVYGLITDAFHLAASYCTVIATGHCFNDGNKRTAFDAMNFCLELHGVSLDWRTEEVGDKVILLAQGLIDEVDLAEWLRALPRT